jgi:predicted nuclease of predicted toxin-antitoxin system
VPESSDVVDATVVATAARHNAEVVTSDPNDMEILSHAVGEPVVSRVV